MPHTHNGHDHEHSHSHAPDAVGLILHRARLYNFLYGRFLRKSEPTILALAGVKTGSKVLDVGCGTAGLTLAAKRRSGPTGYVCGLDASPEMITEAKKQARKAELEIDLRVGLAQNLPWEDGTFDAVMSRLAFHHLPGDTKRQALAEIYRVLKPDGTCLVVDFEQDSTPKPPFWIRLLARRPEMMQTDVTEYVPLFETTHFERTEWGPTGHSLLSYVKGVKPL